MLEKQIALQLPLVTKKVVKVVGDKKKKKTKH